MIVQCKVTVLIILIGLSSCDRDLDKPDRGEVVWSVPNQHENLVGTQPMIEDGKVYFIQDGKLRSYTLEDGQPIWSAILVNQGGGDFSRKIIRSGDRLFIDLGWEVRAYEKANGQLIWETEAANDAEDISGIGSPIMSQDDSNLYIGRDGYVLKMRKSDGQIIMTIPLDLLKPDGIRQGSTEPIISPYEDGILYVPTSYWDDRVAGEEESGGNLFAFDSRTGETVWARRMEFKMPKIFGDNPDPQDTVLVSPFIYDIEITETYIVLLAGRFVSVVDRFTGEEKWAKFFPDDGFDVGLAVEGNGIYTASAGWHATKLDLQTGDILWRRDIKFSNTSIPTIQNGRMYFNNSGGGGIWVLDADNGSVIYHENTPNYRNDNFDVYISSLGVGESYMVNVGSKFVYCLSVP